MITMSWVGLESCHDPANRADVGAPFAGQGKAVLRTTLE